MHDTYLPPAACIWIHHLSYHRARGMLITPTLWRLAVHSGLWLSPTGGVSKRKRTQYMPMSPMWHTAYSKSYHRDLEWRPLVPWNAMWSAGGSQKPQVRPIANKWKYGSYSTHSRVIGR
jgi:hypothetical protein